MKLRKRALTATEELYVVPPFLYAVKNDALVQNYQQQMQIAYVNNPLPTLFKEKVFAYLSRYNHISYAIKSHSCLLYTLGMSAHEILVFLEQAPAMEQEIQAHLKELQAEKKTLTRWPQEKSELERRILDCTIFLFLRPQDGNECRVVLRKILGNTCYEYLMALLLYIRDTVARYEMFSEKEPEIEEHLRRMIEALEKEEPGLQAFFIHYPELVKREAEVIEQQRLEQHTQRMFDSVLAMAEALVLVSEKDEEEKPLVNEQHRLASTHMIGSRLVELARSVLGCKRVGILSVEQEMKVLQPVAVSGLTIEEEHNWWTSIPTFGFQDTVDIEAFVSLFENEEMVLLHSALPPPVPQVLDLYNVQSMLSVPMRIGRQVVGMLLLDYGREEHKYTDEEMKLASAVARLGAIVLEREHLQHERAEAYANELALRESHQRINDFLSIISHELKTPLTAMTVLVQMMERRLNAGRSVPGGQSGEPKPVNVESLYGYVTRVEGLIWFLNRLVDDLLDVARYQANRLELHLDRCDLVTIVRNAVDNMRQVSITRNIRLHIPDEELPVMADADRIGQVLTNYLTNALKYSAEPAPVEVTVRVDGYEVYVLVRDEGPGLSPEEQERVWERFYRVNGIEVKSGSGVGLGLGLHICQAIITQHHGTVGVQSMQGEGSTFWFSLPRLKA